MKNKTLAIMGIVAYILAVIISTTDLEGNPKVPFVLIAMSGIATAVFFFMAALRLWKIKKIVPILCIFFGVFIFTLSYIQETASPLAESSYILLLNIAKVIDLIITAWMVWILWKTPDNEKSLVKSE